MPTHDPIAEFRAAWLPHVTKDGLSRIIELLEKNGLELAAANTDIVIKGSPKLSS